MLLITSYGISEEERFTVEGHSAFLLLPEDSAPGMPWVWYAPTLLDSPLPASEENWMFERFLAAGVAVAGVDVGESYGSPDGRDGYTALYEEMVNERGMSKKPCFLARSRGGLMAYNWAAEHPQAVAGIAGIYPVCNLESYPGLTAAAPAYNMTEAQLTANLADHNPIDRLATLAAADVPIYHMHGNWDTVVPLGENSAVVYQRYSLLGGEMTLEIIEGRGHDMWEGWFQNETLANFVIDNAVTNAPEPCSLTLFAALSTTVLSRRNKICARRKRQK